MTLDDLRRLVQAAAKISDQQALRWEGRIAHPRQLLGGLRGFFEDLGFTVASEMTDKPGSIRDTAHFEGIVVASSDAHATDGGMLAIGIVTLPLLGLGIPIIRAAKRTQRLLVTIAIEGESYLVAAKGVDSRPFMKANTETHAERAGVVGDVRLTVRVAAGSPQRGTDYQLAKVSRDETHDTSPTVEAVSKFIEERWPALARQASQAQAEIRPVPKKRPAKVEIIEERRTIAIEKKQPAERKVTKVERDEVEGEEDE